MKCGCCIVYGYRKIGISHCQLHKTAEKLLATLVEMTECCEESWPDRAIVSVAREVIANAKGDKS